MTRVTFGQSISSWSIAPSVAIRSPRRVIGSTASGVSSAHTAIRSRAASPNVVTMATSTASRPRPIGTRPMRGVLKRASSVHQRSPSQTSNQAWKSIGGNGPGMPMSGM